MGRPTNCNITRRYLQSIRQFLVLNKNSGQGLAQAYSPGPHRLEIYLVMHQMAPQKPFAAASAAGRLDVDIVNNIPQAWRAIPLPFTSGRCSPAKVSILHHQVGTRHLGDESTSRTAPTPPHCPCRANAHHLGTGQSRTALPMQGKMKARPPQRQASGWMLRPLAAPHRPSRMLPAWPSSAACVLQGPARFRMAPAASRAAPRLSRRCKARGPPGS